MSDDGTTTQQQVTPLPVALKDLKEIITDAAELQKGSRTFQESGLNHLSRVGNKLFCEAAGSGASPYKVQMTLRVAADDVVKGRCSCMAARSRPFCKHSAALLVAWASTPEAFVVSDALPAGVVTTGAPKKRETKKSAVDADALLKRGSEQVLTLVSELALAGVSALGDDRAGQVRALADTLREHRLRRLSAKALELSDMLEHAGASVDALPLADLLCDLHLSARRIEKHVAGEKLEPRYVEELIGKTWTKKDRTPVSGLDLVELSYSARTTADDFRIIESRFVDVATGAHYSEKQILPAFLAKRTEPKKTHAGKRLRGATGSAYPGFAPVRLDLEDEGNATALVDDDMKALIACGLPSVAAALLALQERKKDVFAPDVVPVLLRAEMLLAEGERLRLVDDDGASLLLPFHRALAERIASTLRGVKLRAVSGDVQMDNALAVLVPHAVVVEEHGALRLVPLARSEGAALRSGKSSLGASGSARTRFVDVARRAGVSSAAIALGETREELAHALQNGLAGFTTRAAEPIVQRLTDLGLEKPARVVQDAAALPEPRERIEPVLKVHQVTGIALSRLAATAPLDKTTLVPAPTWESVVVQPQPDELAPPAIARAVSRGEKNRFEAAVSYDRYYRSLPEGALAQSIYPTWADGSAMAFVVSLMAQKGDQAIDAAERALGPVHSDAKKRAVHGRAPARMARLTAVAVLRAVGTERARELLAKLAQFDNDETVKAWAARSLGAAAPRADVGSLDVERSRKLRREQARAELVSAAGFDARRAAIGELVRYGDIDAIPLMRAALEDDASSRVREAAALALAQLGDVDSFERFLELVASAQQDGVHDAETLKVGLRCMGALGDVRGIDVLLEAYQAGANPVVVMECIQQIGPAALDALVAFLDDRPELAKRISTKNVVTAMNPAEVTELFVRRLEAIVQEAGFATRARVLLDLSKSVKSLELRVAQTIMALRPDLEQGEGLEDDAKKEARLLWRACKSVIEPPVPKKKAAKAGP